MSITITDRLDHTMSLRDVDEIVQALAHERDAIRRLSNKVGRDESKEEWPGYAWPGGYTIVYICDDGEDLCVDCMNDPDNPVHLTGASDGWKILDVYLAEEAEDDGPALDSAKDGIFAIEDSDFEDYAQELAEELCEDWRLIREARWPFSCIDWEKAADELKVDYTEFEWQGYTYWTR